MLIRVEEVQWNIILRRREKAHSLATFERRNDGEVLLRLFQAFNRVLDFTQRGKGEILSSCLLSDGFQAPFVFLPRAPRHLFRSLQTWSHFAHPLFPCAVRNAKEESTSLSSFPSLLLEMQEAICLICAFHSFTRIFLLLLRMPRALT